MEKNNRCSNLQMCDPRWCFLMVYEPHVELNGNKDFCSQGQVDRMRLVKLSFTI